MIQFKRGTTSVELKEISILGFKFYIPKRTPGSWKDIKLADGQPGYDKAVRKLKVGDGEHTWEELPYLNSGLEAEQILDSELRARARKTLDKDDETIFTYGTIEPDNNMVGQIYFHQYDGDIETDYVIETGINKDWHYRKWNSGYFECWRTVTFAEDNSVNIETAMGSLFISRNIGSLSYPATFREPPTEIVSAEAISFKAPDSASDDTSTVDSIIFVSTAAKAKVNTANTTKKSRHVYLVSPVALNAEVSLNIMVKGILKR